MNKSTKISGFTLIELIVVIIIFSILLSFSFPMFRNFSLFSDDGGQAVSIANLIDNLKMRAVNTDVDFMLHIDTSAGRIWVTHEQMDEEEKEKALQKSMQLDGGTRIIDIQFAQVSPLETREQQIRFKKQGYSDFVYLRMTEQGKNLTLAVEPFLTQTRIVDRHKYFENCN